MWCRAARACATNHHIRAFSTVSANAAQSSVDARARDLFTRHVYRISRYYGRGSGDPVFKLLNMLKTNPAKMVPAHTLQRSGMTVYDFKFLKPAILAPDLDSAISLAYTDRLQGFGTNSTSEAPEPPTWLVLFLICYRVATPADAEKALQLAYRHLPVAPPHLQPSLLIFAACWLAWYDLLVPLRNVITTFLNHPGELRDLHFDVLLQLLSQSSIMKSAGGVLVPILEAASERHIPLSRLTYDTLLQGTSVTPDVGMAIAGHMQAQGITPTVQDLECWIKVFAKAGWRKHAGKCLDLIRSRRIEHGYRTVSFGTNAQNASVEQVVTIPQNWYMSAFSCTASLQSYVAQTTFLDQKQKTRSAKKGISYRSPNPPSHSPTVDTLDLPTATEGLGRPYILVPGVELPPLGGNRLKKATQAGSWRSVLRVAALHRGTSSAALLDAYEQAIFFEPILSLDEVLHLIIIEGLLHRRTYADAARLWDRIFTRKAPETPWAASVRVRLLTLGGRAHEAFAFILKMAAIRDSPATSDSRRLVDIRLINVFMASLQRAGRHDIIFEVWDHLECIFDLHPDQYTVSILFKAARFASKCGQSIQEALADFGLSSRFHKKTAASSVPSTRSEAIEKLERLLVEDKRRVITGQWKGERAGAVALRVASQIFLGNWPELQAVESPAHALRPSASYQAFFPMSDLIHTVIGRSSAHEAQPEPFPPASAYRKIAPTNVMFRAYIDLLAAEGQIPQIPLALAWMQHLDVKPTRDTLAAALVYWAEVSMDAPLIEHWKGGTSEYAKLVRWMRDWVTEDNMPTAAHIGTHIRRVKFFREMRYQGQAVDMREEEEV